MPSSDPTFQVKAKLAIASHLRQRQASLGRARVYLLSYPRSGSTLTRQLLSSLQGRPQYSVYDGDVVGATTAPLTRALDHVEIIKSHQFPTGREARIYLVRDGRNATLSFLYMSYLFGGHRFSRLEEVYDGIRHLDGREGSWADHVARALVESEGRQTLFVRYEDLLCNPQTELLRMARFTNAELPSAAIDECLLQQQGSDSYAKNPNNGYLYEPEKNSIYDLLKRHRYNNFWRYIFDARSKCYFHEQGGTELLVRFGYEYSAEWWKEPAPTRQ